MLVCRAKSDSEVSIAVSTVHANQRLARFNALFRRRQGHSGAHGAVPRRPLGKVIPPRAGDDHACRPFNSLAVADIAAGSQASCRADHVRELSPEPPTAPRCRRSATAGLIGWPRRIRRTSPTSRKARWDFPRACGGATMIRRAAALLPPWRKLGHDFGHARRQEAQFGRHPVAAASGHGHASWRRSLRTVSAPARARFCSAIPEHGAASDGVSTGRHVRDQPWRDIRRSEAVAVG